MPKRGGWLSKLSQSFQKKTELVNYDLMQYFYHIHHHSSIIVIINTIGGKRVDIQVEERHEQEFKDKRSTQLRQSLLEICF